jgi:peptide/nickel transport system permease protein
MDNTRTKNPANPGELVREDAVLGTGVSQPRSAKPMGVLVRRAMQKTRSGLRGVPIIPAIVLPLFVFMGLFGTFIMPHDPNQIDLMYAINPPFWQEKGTTGFLLGTDHLGRDIMSRILGGAGISLQVGFVVVFIAGGIGAIIALVSGYVGGKTDAVLMRLTDMMLSLPYLLMAIVLAAVLQPSKYNIILVLAVMGWSRYARVLRSEVLRIKEGDFIRLAKVNGCGNLRIMLRHIFPNIVNTLVILATLQLGGVIIAEAALSFIGVGIPPPHPAWGSMLAEGRQYIARAWWMCVWPGVAILLVVLSCNLLGDWLRVRLDPKFRQM